MNTGCQTFQTIIKTDTTYFLKIKKTTTSKQLAKQKRGKGRGRSLTRFPLGFWRQKQPLVSLLTS